MKKILLSVILFFGLAVHVNAGQVVTISKQAANIIKSLKSSDLVAVRTDDPTKKTYLLKFNAKTVVFEDLYKTSVEEFVDSELKFPSSSVRGTFVQVNSDRKFKKTKNFPYGNYNGICISFIISVIKKNIAHRLKHRKQGKRLTPNAKIKAGTIIFSHSKKKGKKVIKTGHIAILLKVSKKYIWVMDQNSYVKLLDSKKRGIVEIHKIMFKDKVGGLDKKYYDNKNAYNYHVLEIWHIICPNVEEASASSKLL